MDPDRRFDHETHHAVQNPEGEGPGLAETDHIKCKYLDIPYAKVSPLQKLDIYLPNEEEGPYPVILSIHGGAFMGCDKSDGQVNPMLRGLDRGYAVVAVNYRLSWEAVFPALVHDVKAAVRWVRANAGKYDFDPERIASWGGSAGGYQSTMLGVTDGIPELTDLNLGNPGQPSNIQVVVDWFGPTNFLTMDKFHIENGNPPLPGTEHSHVNSPESWLVGGDITEMPEKVKAANPETYIRDNACPFLIQHGDRDPVVPFQHSRDLAEKLRRAIGEDKVELEIIEGAEHGDDKFETPENVARCLDFIDKWLR